MATTKTTNAGLEAGKPQPQTTTESPGGPFIRYSQPGRMPQYRVTGQAFGSIITQPLVARPGYYSRFRVRIHASGGVNGTKDVAVKGDAPFNVAAQMTFKDAFGTPIFTGTGYAILYLVPMIGGSYGTMKYATIKSFTSYSAPSTGTSGTGNFTFGTVLPLEFAKGIGVIAGANASLPPSLTWNLNSSAAVYSTAPGTLPTISVQVDSDYYWLPEGSPTVEPPMLGTTRQWLVQPTNPTVASGTTQRIQFPRLGGYMTVICVVARNKTNVRVDAWPGYTDTTLTTATARLRLIIDGVPVFDTTIGELLDDWQITWPTVTRPTGVIAFSRRTGMNQTVLGLLTSGEQWLSTNPGTLIELTGSPWGKFATGPAQITALLGQIVPSGALLQGLPEL